MIPAQNTSSSPRLHAQTLAEINCSVNTARRDAAYSRLCVELLETPLPGDLDARHNTYSKCLLLIQEAVKAMERSSLPSQMTVNKPLLCFMNIIQQILMTLCSITEHARNVRDEAELLKKILGTEVFGHLQETCRQFDGHESSSLEALQDILRLSRTQLTANTQQRLSAFSEEEKRRYDKTYAEYTEHYTCALPNGAL